jgi:hypothetical protein
MIKARQEPTAQERESIRKYPWGAPLPDNIATNCNAAPPARIGYQISPKMLKFISL